MAKAMLFLFLLCSLKITLALNNEIYNETITENGHYIEAIKSIARCIIEAAKIDLFYKSTILIHHADEISITTVENELLDIMIYEFSFGDVPLIATDNLNIINAADDVATRICIFITVDCKDLERLTFESMTTKYLFIIIGDMKSCNRTFQKSIGNIIAKDITFAVLDNSGYFTFMYAKLEIDDITCNITHIVKFQEVNRCADGSLRSSKSIFPKKILRDFKKCPLNSGVATLHPYMIIQNKDKKYENLDPISELDMSGSDVEIIKIASQYFNTTLNFYYIYREEENPFANKEFIDLVLNGSLDICAGGLYRVYGDAVDYSGVYTRQAVIWVYSVEREIRSWQSFVKKVNGLYIFFLFYLLYAIVWKPICKIDRQAVSIKDTLLYSLGTLLGSSSLQDARTLKQKIVNAMYMIMSLHFSAYIAVQLYSYLTIQGPPHFYKTIDDLILSGTKPYLRLQSKYFIEDKKYETFANTSGSCDHFMDCEEVIMKNKGTTVLIDGFLAPFQAKTAVEDEARVVRVNEEMLFVYHEMVIRKNSYFSEPFQRMLLRLLEAGICQKLHRDGIGIMYVDKAKIANKNIMSNSYSCQMGCAITLAQTAGAFYIWIFGCLLSCIVFWFEIFMRKKVMPFIE